MSRITYLIHTIFDASMVESDIIRRRNLLNVFVFGMGAIAVIGILVTVLDYDVTDPDIFRVEVLPVIIGGLLPLAGGVVVYLINRFWSVHVASSIFLLLLTLGIALADKPEQVMNGRSLSLFAIPIIMGSYLIASWASFVVAGASAAVIYVISLSLETNAPTGSIVGLFAIALAAWLAAQGLEKALRQVRTLNQSLDRRVQEQTRELADALVREHADSERTSAILQGIADGVVVFGNDDRVVRVNRAITTLLGIPEHEFLGRSFDKVMDGCVSAEDREIVGMLLADKGRIHPSIKIKWDDKTLSISIAAVRDWNRDVFGTVAVVRDFTREAELDRMKSDFVSIAAHELRTPMTSITGYLDLLLAGAPGPLNDMQKQFVRTAQNNTVRLVSLVNDLLDVSSIESGKIELHPRPMDLAELVTGVAQFLQRQFDERNLVLTLDIQDDLPQVYADSNRINQVVTNLLSNACKYTAQGGATVRVHTSDSVVQVDVADTGVGMSHDDLQRLFSPFFRSDNEYVRQQTGTGLGMSITKSLVELHGGSMWVDSKLREGSTFHFTLPIDRFS